MKEWEKVDLVDKLEWIDSKDIDYIEWDYGDGIKEKWWINAKHSYKKDWVYVVKARVIKDGKVISESTITLKVWNTTNIKSILVKDSDDDGIPDSEDACPNVPENYNWVNDKDWCPEIWKVNDAPQLKIVWCNTCPCQFADYSSPFVHWLNIEAYLVNPLNYLNIYSKSKPYLVK